jgi:hypothetical protein
MPLNRYCLVCLLLAATSLCGATPLAKAESGKATAAQLLTQKISLLENLLARTTASKRFAASDNLEARELVAQATELTALARENLAAGRPEVASQGVDEAFKRVFAATRMLKKEPGSTLVERMRFEELMEAIDSLKSGSASTRDPEAERLIADARARADQDDYAGALKLLSQAYEMTASAVALSRDQETVVYTLDFASPKDEYDYEVRRFEGNRMVIDLLLRKHPGTTAALVKSYVSKAEEMRLSAATKAANGNFEDAVRDMEEAGRHQERAMGLLGIQS